MKAFKVKIFDFTGVAVFLALTCAALSSVNAFDFKKAAGKILPKNDVISEDSAKAIFNSAKAINAASEKFTPEQEYYIGRAVAGTIFAQYKPYNNKTAQLYLNKICKALVINSEKPELFKGYFVAILDSDEINALSSSGGHILITRGLINCALSEDALAAVIAHEIAHIHLQHGISAIKQSRKTEAVKTIANAALTVAAEKNSDSAKLVQLFDESIGDVVSTMVNSGYSQKQEFEADALALRLMADAGYKVEAMNEMLGVLKSKSASNKRGFAKTHPSADARIKNVSGEYKKYSVPDTTAARVQRYDSNKL